jgi:hypothetical protein
MDYIWIDAICINQGDPDKRSEQMSMMADIYSKAKQVIVWLGRSDPKLEEAIALIQKYGHLQLCMIQKNSILFNNVGFLTSNSLPALTESQ